jgi:hypothetical protein
MKPMPTTLVSVHCNRSPSIIHRIQRLFLALLASGLVILGLLACQPVNAPKAPMGPVIPVPERISPPKLVQVPGWYAELPAVAGCRLGQAYSGVYLDVELQKQALLENGAANMAKNERVHVKVGWAGTQSSGYSQTASYILEQGWEERAAALRDQLEVIRQFTIERATIGLVALCSSEPAKQSLDAMLNDSLVNVALDQPPEWVREHMSDSRYVFGVGASASRTTPARAWEEAERQSRADLVLRLAAHAWILDRDQSSNVSASSQRLSETSSELSLSNIQILRHAYSNASRTFYVLVRMPLPSRQRH